MGLVNKKTGRGSSGNILDKAIIAFYRLHTVNEQAGVGNKYYLPLIEIMVGDYRQCPRRLTFIPNLVAIQVKEAERRGQGEGISRCHISQDGGMVEDQASGITGQRARFKVDNPRELLVFVIYQRVKESLP